MSLFKFTWPRVFPLLAVLLVSCDPSEKPPKASAEQIERWRQMADLGNSDAQYNLGICYAEGQENLPKDEAQAIKWFTKSAENGLPLGQLKMGNCYAKGIGVQRNESMAYMWWCLSSASGDSRGGQNLENLAKKMTKQQIAEAQYNSYGLYAKDVAKPINTVKWFANQGHVIAQHELGNLYAAGAGVPKDDTEAARWFGMAADRGYPPAQLSIALAYFDGIGVPKDNIKAYMWWNIVAAAGETRGAQCRDTIVKEMTNQQISEAQKLSREWKPNKGANGQ